MAAELGLPAAGLYVGFLLYALALAWRYRGEAEGAGALGLGLVLAAVANTSIGATYQPLVWFGVGFGPWLRHRAGAVAASAPPSKP
jgi:hypothetical protein